MDPNANLREQLEIARVAVDFENPGFARLAELVLALDEWRTKGGFDPYAPALDEAEIAALRSAAETCREQWDGTEPEDIAEQEALASALAKLGAL